MHSRTVFRNVMIKNIVALVCSAFVLFFTVVVSHSAAQTGGSEMVNFIVEQAITFIFLFSYLGWLPFTQNRPFTATEGQSSEGLK